MNSETKKDVAIEELSAKAQALIANIEKAVFGKYEAVKLVAIGLLAGGHALIEDIPGVGKTTLAKALANSIDGKFKRIQFTPDLLPADITGISIYDPETREFAYKPGPVFANIVLSDEINRTTPRTQSALLEAMNSGTVTVDLKTFRLPQPFMVIATQNPLEFTGTYPLPESQMDRFLLHINLDYPGFEAEKEIILSQRSADPLAELQPVISLDEINHIAEVVREITVEETVLEYLLTLIEKTRNHRGLSIGASPRASLGLYRSAQAHAFIEGRNYVMPDDIKYLATATLGHRIVAKERRKSTSQSKTEIEIIEQIVSSTPVPA